MNEKELKEKYCQLDFNIAKWKLMSEKSFRLDFWVSISSIEEIDYDVLYYYYKNNLYEVDLTRSRLEWGGTLRDALKACIKEKNDKILPMMKSPEEFGPENTILKYSSSGKGQVMIDLNMLGNFIFPYVPQATPEEIAATKKETTLQRIESLIMRNKAAKESASGIAVIFGNKVTNGAEIDVLLDAIANSQNVGQAVILELCALLLEDKW